MEVKVKGGDVASGRVPPDEIFAEGGGIARVHTTAPADDARLNCSSRTLVRAGQARLRLRNNDRGLAVNCRRRCSVFALCRGAAPAALTSVVAVRREAKIGRTLRIWGQGAAIGFCAAKGQLCLAALWLDIGIELGALGVGAAHTARQHAALFGRLSPRGDV